MLVVHEQARHAYLKQLKLQTEATGEILEAFDRNLSNLKQNARRFSFDDVSHQLADWIGAGGSRQSASDLKRLALRMDASLDHVLLDEFQDTAPVQWDVIRPFALRAGTGAPSELSFAWGTQSKRSMVSATVKREF
ncbi:MAG: UvrD-helicase domain-containing protein [Pirellulaceae bacterium]